VRWLALLVLCGCDHLLQLDDVLVVDAGPDIDMGLVAYYPLDDIGADPNACAQDGTGHGHDGACTTGMPTLVRGRIGQAFGFDGKSLVAIAFASDFNSDSGTVAFWLQGQITSTTTFECVVNRQYGDPMGSQNSWQVCIDEFNSSIFFGASTRSIEINMLQALDGNWHHIAMSWNPFRTGGWFDGIPMYTLNGPVMQDTGGLSFGADIDGGMLSAPVIGNLDDIRFYDRVLVDSEVGALAAM
jgi:hypothetical protein